MNIFVFIELVEIKTYEADEQPERNNIFFFLYYKKETNKKVIYQNGKSNH